MAYQSIWHATDIDEEIIELFKKQIKAVGLPLVEGEVGGGSNEKAVDHKMRNSDITWVSTNHWIAPLIWYYIQKTNDENFRFDITGIGGSAMQYSEYSPGQYYQWHVDDSPMLKHMWGPADINQERPDWIDKGSTQVTRKLSFSLILSDPSEYEGGQFQFLGYDHKMYQAPQDKGTLIIFDSKAVHRVRPVKKGIRKSLVGWAVGPRWR
jgi:hypothetical protein